MEKCNDLRNIVLLEAFIDYTHKLEFAEYVKMITFSEFESFFEPRKFFTSSTCPGMQPMQKFESVIVELCEGYSTRTAEYLIY